MRSATLSTRTNSAALLAVGSNRSASMALALHESATVVVTAPGTLGLVLSIDPQTCLGVIHENLNPTGAIERTAPGAVRRNDFLLGVNGATFAPIAAFAGGSISAADLATALNSEVRLRTAWAAHDPPATFPAVMASSILAQLGDPRRSSTRLSGAGMHAFMQIVLDHIVGIVTGANRPLELRFGRRAALRTTFPVSDECEPPPCHRARDDARSAVRQPLPTEGVPPSPSAMEEELGALAAQIGKTTAWQRRNANRKAQRSARMVSSVWEEARAAGAAAELLPHTSPTAASLPAVGAREASRSAPYGTVPLPPPPPPRAELLRGILAGAAARSPASVRSRPLRAQSAALPVPAEAQPHAAQLAFAPQDLGVAGRSPPRTVARTAERAAPQRVTPAKVSLWDRSAPPPGVRLSALFIPQRPKPVISRTAGAEFGPPGRMGSAKTHAEALAIAREDAARSEAAAETAVVRAVQQKERATSIMAHALANMKRFRYRCALRRLSEFARQVRIGQRTLSRMANTKVASAFVILRRHCDEAAAVAAARESRLLRERTAARNAAKKAQAQRLCLADVQLLSGIALLPTSDLRATLLAMRRTAAPALETRPDAGDSAADSAGVLIARIDFLRRMSSLLRKTGRPLTVSGAAGLGQLFSACSGRESHAPWRNLVGALGLVGRRDVAGCRIVYEAFAAITWSRDGAEIAPRRAEEVGLARLEVEALLRTAMCYVADAEPDFAVTSWGAMGSGEVLADAARRLMTFIPTPMTFRTFVGWWRSIGPPMPLQAKLGRLPLLQRAPHPELHSSRGRVRAPGLLAPPVMGEPPSHTPLITREGVSSTDRLADLLAHGEHVFTRVRLLSTLVSGIEPALLLRAHVACTEHTRAALVDVRTHLDAVRKEHAMRRVLASGVNPQWHGLLHERSTSQWIVLVESTRASHDLAKAAHATQRGEEARAVASRVREIRKEVERQGPLAESLSDHFINTESLLELSRGKARRARDDAARATSAERNQIAAMLQSKRERETLSVLPRQSTAPEADADASAVQQPEVVKTTRATGPDAASLAERFAMAVERARRELTRRYTKEIFDIRAASTARQRQAALANAADLQRVAEQRMAKLAQSGDAAKLERRVAVAAAASRDLEQRCSTVAETLVARRARARIARAETVQRDAELARSQRVQAELHHELHGLLRQGHSGVAEAIDAIFARQRKQRSASTLVLCRAKIASMRTGASDTFRIRKRILKRERVARCARLARYCCESPQAAKDDGSRAVLKDLTGDAELHAPAALAQLQRDLDSLNDIVASEISIAKSMGPRSGVRGVYVRGGASVTALLAQCIAAGSSDAELVPPPTVRKWRAAQAKCAL